MARWTTFLQLAGALLCSALNRASVVPHTADNVTSVVGSAQFRQLIASEGLTLVKFFHPRCPHCTAFAPHFTALAALINEHNQQANVTAADRVFVAEVDASKPENNEIVTTHADFFPTTKLFSSGRLVSEYTGVRRPGPMWDYVRSALRFRSSEIVQYLATREDLDAFLRENVGRPVVASIFHPDYDPAAVYPPHVRPSSEIWHAAVAHMRNGSAPSVAFAAVAEPTLLLPSNPETHASYHRVARVPFAPALVAAPHGAHFWRVAEWWFPGLRESDSMETFMHVSVLGEGDYVVLNSLNAPYILKSRRPLAIVFGTRAPSWQDREFLRSATKQTVKPRFVGLYVNTSEHVGFAEHVGVIGEDVGNGRSDTVFVVYQAGITYPHIARYEDGSEDSLSGWFNKQAVRLNQSDVTTMPGEVVELDGDSWKYIFEHDGRGVLLELYRSDCRACKRFSQTYGKVARMLTLHAGAIVVARFDLRNFPLPVSPKLPFYGSVPTVVYVPPGGEAVAFEGSWAPKALAKFARFQADIADIPFHRLRLVEAVAMVLFQAGLVLTLSGTAIWRRAQKKKNEHVT